MKLMIENKGDRPVLAHEPDHDGCTEIQPGGRTSIETHGNTIEFTEVGEVVAVTPEEEAAIDIAAGVAGRPAPDTEQPGGLQSAFSMQDQ